VGYGTIQIYRAISDRKGKLAALHRPLVTEVNVVCRGPVQQINSRDTRAQNQVECVEYGDRNKDAVDRYPSRRDRRGQNAAVDVTEVLNGEYLWRDPYSVEDIRQRCRLQRRIFRDSMRNLPHSEQQVLAFLLLIPFISVGEIADSFRRSSRRCDRIRSVKPGPPSPLQLPRFRNSKVGFGSLRCRRAFSGQHTPT